MSAERDRYIELRRQGTETFAAFQQACGGRRSHTTRELWERWFRALEGLPPRPSGFPASWREHPAEGDF